ncbi:hypothetical protein VPH35_020976 [Triticum aestivum]
MVGPSPPAAARPSTVKPPPPLHGQASAAVCSRHGMPGCRQDARRCSTCNGTEDHRCSALETTDARRYRILPLINICNI